MDAIQEIIRWERRYNKMTKLFDISKERFEEIIKEIHRFKNIKNVIVWVSDNPKEAAFVIALWCEHIKEDIKPINLCHKKG